MKRTTCRFCRQFLVHQGRQDLKSLSRTGAVKDDSKIYPFSNPNSASAIRQDVEESMRLRSDYKIPNPKPWTQDGMVCTTG